MGTKLAAAMALVALAAWTGGPGSATAQEARAGAESAARARGGAEFRIPAGSLLVPGLGQFLRGSLITGAAFSATAMAGYALYLTGDTSAVSTSDLPRHPDGQQALTGVLMISGAGYLSAYDAFTGALPALQREGKYRFVTSHAPTTTLLTAPFDPEFLTRWTTWIHLAYTGAIVVILLNEREPGVAYEPFKARDAAFATGLSLSAGAGEEALFRGWLFPLLHQNTGERFWLSNGTQAVIFGGLHVPQAKAFAAAIAAWAFYEGWLTRRNGWNVRESIFHHFWYDVLVVTATFMTDKRTPGLALRLPPIHF